MSGSAVESGRAVLRCRYWGPTNTRESRVRVMRFDGGRDPNAVTVGWDHSLDPTGNYVAAVQRYLDRAGWSGSWTVSTVTDGAVAVYVPGTDQHALADLVDARAIVGECGMAHLLSSGSDGEG